DAEPATRGELALPRQAQLPPRVVGRSPDTGMTGELSDEMLRQPVADLLASRRLAGSVVEVHQVSVRRCGARGLPLRERTAPGAMSYSGLRWFKASSATCSSIRSSREPRQRRRPLGS